MSVATFFPILQFHSPSSIPSVTLLPPHNVRYFTSMSTPENQTNKAPSTRPPPHWKHASRTSQHASNPTSTQRRDARNTAILKQVQERRQNARDSTRSEHILRSDILAEQRAWEFAQQAEAARWMPREEEDVSESINLELEEFVRREEEELQASLAVAMQNIDGFGVENEEDFDMLALEAMEEFERAQQDSGRDMELS